MGSSSPLVSISYLVSLSSSSLRLERAVVSHSYVILAYNYLISTDVSLKWRYTLFFGHFASELSLLFSPSPSSPEYQGYSILSVLFPTRLAFQHIRLLHQVCCFVAVYRFQSYGAITSAFHVLQYCGVACSSRSLPRCLGRCFQRVPCPKRSCDIGEG